MDRRWQRYLIGLLSFGVGIVFIPGIVSAGTVPRWVLIALAPCLIELRQTKLTVGHFTGVLFLGWCWLSLIWTSNKLDGLNELFQLMLLAAVFVVGNQAESLRKVYIGLGLALWVSSAVIIVQRYFDPTIVWPGTDSAPSGIFVNANTAAEITAMVAVGAVVQRLYWLLPGLIPALWLCDSRGAWLGLAAAISLWLWNRSKPAAVGVVLFSILAAFLALRFGFKPISNYQRLLIYFDVINGLTFWGHGIGSFQSVFPYYATHIDTFHFVLDHAHSDLLEYWFELGPGALLLIALIAIALNSAKPDRLVLACFIGEALVGFPSHLPATAFLAACVMGFLCQDSAVLRDQLERIGIFLQHFLSNSGFKIGRDGGSVIGGRISIRS